MHYNHFEKLLTKLISLLMNIISFINIKNCDGNNQMYTYYFCLLQILEVNGASLSNVSHNRALELLRGTTHLSLNVKCNLLGKTEVLVILPYFRYCFVIGH